MVVADNMSDELIDKLVELAKSNDDLWTALKDREIDQFNPDGSPKLPSASMLIRELINKECGADNKFTAGPLTIRLRFLIRKELDLPV